MLQQGFTLNNRYQIIRTIGQGGFGITYEAKHINLDKIVCIKELFIKNVNNRAADFSIRQNDDTFPYAYILDKFINEARKISIFEHQNIVRVIDLFQENNTAYIAMDFIKGETLKAKISNAIKFGEDEIISIMKQLLDAVEEIHNKRIIHRDIKPENIMITNEGRVVLIDFGTSKNLIDEQDSSFDDETIVVLTTMIIITPGFAGPEQYSDWQVKANYTDIYSIGATFYNLLTGFEPVRVNDRIAGRQLDKLNQGHKYYNIVMKAMHLDPRQRYQSVQEMRNDLFKLNGKYEAPIKEIPNEHVKQFESLQNFSKKFVDQSVINSKTFIDYSNSNRKFTFRTNGDLYFIDNGILRNEHWKCIGQKDIILSAGNTDVLYTEIYIDENILCIKKVSSNQILLLINENMRKDINDYIRSLYVKYLNLVTGKISDGRNIEVYDCDFTDFIALRGKKVTIDLKEPQNGRYLNLEKTRYYVIEDGKISKVIFLHKFECRNGTKLVIESLNENSISINNLAFIDDEPAPDDVYRLGIFSTITIEDGKVMSFFWPY